MRVRCVKSISNPDIRVGEIYNADRNAFGWSVRYSKGTHVMPDDVFRQSFIEI